MGHNRALISGRRFRGLIDGGRAVPYPIEALERRQLLSAAALAAVPASIDPALAEQTLFAPGQTRLELPSPMQSRLLEFALDTQVFSAQAKFTFGPAITPHPGDTAIGIYDQNGNLLKKVDADIADLEFDLNPRRPYILGLFFGANPAPETYALELTTAPQVVNATLAINPGTGLGASAGLSLEDSFNTPADVDYYPLDLTNAGTSGNVTISPTGLDVQVAAALFWRPDSGGAWKRIASGADPGGNPVVLPIAAPANGTLSDGQYLLSVAPVGFNTPARSYDISVVAANLIGPASASGVSATELLTVPPTSPGVAGLSRPDLLAAGGGKYFRFRVPAGPLTVSVASGAIDPALSIYTADGTLLDVATRTGSGAATWSLPEVDDEVLVVFVSDVGGNAGGAFNLSITATYEPVEVAIGSPYAVVGPIALGVNQPASILRVQPNFGSDLLLIETQSTVESRLRIVRANAPWIEHTIPVGKRLFPIDLTSAPGVYDLFIVGANAGSVSLRIGQFDVPQFIPLNALTSAELSLAGDSTITNTSAGSFGTMKGIRFYQHVNEPGNSTLSVQGSAGSTPLLVHYIADGSSLKLSSFQLADLTTGLATMSEDLGEFKLHGLATFALGFDGVGTSQYSVSGPDLVAVGVGMVPDPPPPVPQQNPINGNPTPPPPDPANFYSWLKIRNVVLQHDYERDFWATILPLNMIGNPVVRAIPTAGSPLALNVTIYDEDLASPGVLSSIGQINTAPGTMGTFNISNYATRQGHRIHFHVRPISGDIGDGMYTLEMQVETTNPHPFEVTEPNWEVGATQNVIYSFGNSETWKDVIQNQFGYGSMQSSFTTSLPLRTGSVDVFRFWVETPGPVVVRTVALSPTVNTNLKLYRALFDANGAIDRLVEMQDVPVSFDWMPADRSEVDAQVYVNNYDLLRYTTGSQAHYGLNEFGMYFAVVKNQEGSTGNYRIEVDAPDFPMLGAAGTAATSFSAAKGRTTAYIDPTDGGSVQIRPQFTEDMTDFVGYFPIQLPDYHSVNFTVASSFGYWDFALFNSNGVRLNGAETDHPTAIPYTSASFTVQSGPQTVYLRAREQNIITNANATLTVTNVVHVPAAAVEPLPPSLIPRTLVPRMILTNPFGDAEGSLRGSGTMFTNGEVRAFEFKAAAGPLTVKVAPNVAGGVTLQWAVYVNNVLLAWDQTSSNGGVFDASSLTTTVLLPLFRAEGLEPIEPYEKAPMHNVVVYVKAVSTPTSGGYTVEVDSASTLPHRTGPDIKFDVLDAAPTASITTDGTEWSRLFVPAHTSGGVSLLVGSGEVGTSRYSYSLYDHAGSFIASGFVNPGLFGLANIPLPAAVGGSMYYLRVGVEANAGAEVSVNASITLPKANGNKPSVTSGDINESIVRSVSPTPDGAFRYYTVQKPNPVSQPTLVQYETFWVDQGGVVKLTANWATPGVHNFNTPNMTMAVHRISISGGEFPQNIYNLVDYANDSNWSADGEYAMSLYLDPGAYLLRVDSPLSNTTGGAVDYELPEYRVEEAVLDPNFGTSSLVHLQAVDNVISHTTSAFRTRFVHAVAPVGALGPFSALGVLYSGGANPQDRDASLAMLQRNAQGEYAYIQNTGGTDSRLTSPAPDTAAVQPFSAIAEPGKDYWMVLNRRSLSGKAGIGMNFPVPVSGTPDLVVQSIELSPNDGETRVDVKVFNQGYAPTLITHSLFQITDTSKNPDVTTSAELLELPVAPLGSHAWVLPWLPVRPEDWVQFTADHDDQVEELNELNNKPSEVTPLSIVDAHRPVVSLSLGDAQMDGNSNGNVWGRYLSGVDMLAEIVMSITDQDGDMFRALTERPYYMPANSSTGQYTVFSLAGKGVSTEVDFNNYNFGRLNPTGPDNPNVVRVQVRDAYGLLSDWAEKTIQVMPMPNWLESDPDQISYNYDTHKYDIDFKNDVVRQEGTLDQITGTGIPFIGDKMNRFLIAIGAKGSVSLNPTQAVNLPLTAQAEIKVLGATVLDEHWDGSAQPTDHFEISTIVVIDPLTVSADQFNVTFRLVDLPLFNYESPKIPLFAYGVPGIASISANLSFSVNAYLNAALTVAIQTDLNDPLNISRIGLAAPTFIMPTIQAGLTISGDVTFIGFDLASLYGSIFFGLNLGYGLPTTAPSFVPFLDFFDEAILDITGELSGAIGAEILGIEIFEIDFPTVTIDFTGGPDIQTMTAIAENLIGQGLAEAAQSLPGGNSLVGELNIHESPQIAIDPITGEAMYVQVIDSDPGIGGRGVLNVATRQGSSWSSGLSPLPGTAHITNPLLAFTNDGPSSPAVVVYQAHNSQTPHLLTRNQYLGGQDIRYRYYDGENWMPEQALTNDALFDSSHAMAFNDSGEGVLAWVRNRNASPLDDTGALDRNRNEIVVSRWSDTHQAWTSPLVLTSDDVGDSSPAAYAADDGTLLVVWKRDTAAGAQLYYARYAGGSWSVPAPLAVSGMPPGEIRSLAVGGDGAGNVSVVFAHAYTDPATQQVDSRLFARTTSLAGFGGTASLEEIAVDANFSNVRVTNAPDGALVAYWQHSTGERNDIYAARIGGGSNTWSKPFPLTASTLIEVRPSLAVDTNGDYALVYEIDQPIIAATPPLPDSPQYFPVPFPDLPPVDFPDAVPTVPLPVPVADDVGTAKVGVLPELAFTRPMVFPFMDKAASGAKALAEATIINRGAKTTEVAIETLDITAGGQVVLDRRRIVLGPGSTYDISHEFVVLPGERTYAFRITPVGLGEAFSNADNISSAVLVGLPDIAVTDVSSFGPSGNAGATLNISAEVTNLSGLAIGSFDVKFIYQDPTNPNSVAASFGSTSISLAPFETKIVTLPWTVLAGSHVITVIADANEVIAEATEFNNEGHLVITARPDALVENVTGDIIHAALQTGRNNVQIGGTIRNIGKAPLANVPVHLLWSLDTGEWKLARSMMIPSLAAGASVPVNFTGDGLAGVNDYRIVVDPTSKLRDRDRSNNFAGTSIVIQGLPDLMVDDFELDKANPIQGQSLNLTTTLHNLGIAKARNIKVEVLARSVGGIIPQSMGGLVIGQLMVDELDALAEIELVIPLATHQLLGLYELVLVVDRPQDILEMTDLNNEVGKRVNFQSGGTLVQGTAGADTIYVRLDASAKNIEVFVNVVGAPSGSPTMTVAYASSQALTFTTLGGDDRLIVDLSKGVPIGTGGMHFNADGDFDRIIIHGTPGIDSISVSDAAILIGGRVLGHGYVESIQIDAKGGGDSLSVNTTIPVELMAAQVFSSVNLLGASHLNVWQGGDNMLVTNALSMSAGSTLDLTDNAMIIQVQAGPAPGLPAATLTAVTDLIRAARNGPAGKWMNPGITTSMLSAQAGGAGLGSLLNDLGGGQLLYNSFEGVAVNANSVIVRFTTEGDLDLSRKMDGDDYFLADRGYLSQLGLYLGGDVNYDTRTDGKDYHAIDLAYLRENRGRIIRGESGPEAAQVSPFNTAAPVNGSQALAEEPVLFGKADDAERLFLTEVEDVLA